MNKRKNRRKCESALWFLILFLLICSGCGRQEYLQEELVGEESGQSEESAVGTVPPKGGETVPSVAVPPKEGEIVPSVAVAPLLEWEDLETENLADMLQDTCGGMMVQLVAGQFLGSGVIYGDFEDRLVIVTAGHVMVDAADGVKVTFVDGWEMDTTDFFLSELADLAVIKVPLTEIPSQRLENYMAVNVDKPGYDNMRTGDGCIVMGCRSGVAEDAYEGIVLEPWIFMEDYGQYMTWVRAAGKPGMSGGGLFDRQGHFLGILSGRSEDGEWAVVPLALMLEALNLG